MCLSRTRMIQTGPRSWLCIETPSALSQCLAGRNCPLAAGHVGEEGSGGMSRCQRALGTASSWPRDLSTQTFFSDQGSDSIEQKCHGLQPRGGAENKKRGKGSSGQTPQVAFALLTMQPRDKSGQWNKGKVLLFQAQAWL